MTLSYDACVTWDLKKFKFFHGPRWLFLFYQFSWGPRTTYKYNDAIRWLHNPTALTAVPSFLRFCNIFCSFVPNIDLVASQLNNNLHRGQSQTFDTWAEEKHFRLWDAERDIGAAPCSCPSSFAGWLYNWHQIMEQPDWMCPSAITTQWYWQVYWILSRSLNDNNCTYDTIHWKGLPLVCVVWFLLPSLKGYAFTAKFTTTY